MSDINTTLHCNATKCMDLLHKLLAAWVVLCLVAAYLPSGSTTSIKLPFSEIIVPVNSARWTCAVLIFFVGMVGCAILKQLSDLCKSLVGSDHLVAVITYPSVCTLGSPWQRAFLGYGLAFAQYSVGLALWSPMPKMFGGSPDIGLAFLYASPMFWFAWDLRDCMSSHNRSLNSQKAELKSAQNT